MKMCKRLGVAILVMALLLSGCSQGKLPKVIDRTTISIAKDGSVTAYVVEEFDKDYYELSELKDMAMKEVEEYNSNASNGQDESIPVNVKEVEMVVDSDNLVSVVYDFDTVSVYSDFIGQYFFYDTAARAKLENIKFELPLHSVKDNTLLSEEQLFADVDRKIIITDAEAVIYCSGKVTHVSEGAVYNEDGSVDTRGTEGLVYIILK